MASLIISKVQVENNDVVSFLNGTTYIRSMSQILPQSPTYISYRYDSITISQVGGEAFTFTVYAITDVGGNAFTALNFSDPADVVQAKTVEIYRLLVTAIFKGCCECGDTMPECSIQYTSGDVMTLGRFQYDGSSVLFNYVTGNNQDFTGFFPIVQDGSWVFVFSKTDPTVYAVIQLSNFTDFGTYCKFDAIELNANGVPFVEGTQFCIDFTSVGGSLVQGWQDTLDINSTLDKDNTVDGAGYNFVFDNNTSFVINSAGGSVETNAVGASINAGANQVTVTAGYVDIITPLYSSATTGQVLALTAGGHVEYTAAGTGTVTYVGLDMPPAFTVTGSPIEDTGTFGVTVEGTEDQYINGLGELATFPVYTVVNGLHTKEAPSPDPNIFHLGGDLIENTEITTETYKFSVVGSSTQDTNRPFNASNTGLAGVAQFYDFASGDRTHASVNITTDIDLFQPALDLVMNGNLPAGGILDGKTAMLRLKYNGEPSLAAMSIDYEFINDGVSPEYFIGGRLTTEVTSYTQNDEQSKFKLELFDGGSPQTNMEVSGPGQLTLNNYGTGAFLSTVPYILGVKSDGTVWKTSAGTGTVTSVGVTAGTGISASVANPTTTPVITITNTAPDQVVSLTGGTGISTGGTYPNFTIANTAPDQVVSIGTTGTGLSVSGTYPSFTLQNTLPDQIVSLTAGSNVTITGAYPNFTIAASGGPGTTYDSNQGIYKDTTLTNDTFQLGAPSGSEGAIAFSINRFISTADKQLTFSGITSGSSTAAPVRIVNSYTGTSQAYALSLQSGVNSSSFGGVLKINAAAGGPYGILCDTIDGTGIYVTATNARGIETRSYTSNALVASSTASSSLISAIAAVKQGSSSGNDDVLQLSKTSSAVASAGIKNSIAFFNGNSTSGSSAIIAGRISYSFTDPTNGSQDAKYHVSVVENNIDNTRLEIESTGQLKLNAYTTSTSFAGASGASVGVLNVDNTGKVFVGTGGTGSSPLTTKGDIYTFSTVDTRLPVGTNGYILSANSAEATGLKWVSAPTVSGITTINGATEAVQEFFIVFGDTGESTPTIITSGGDHTIHIPYADGGRDGVITAAQFLDFSAKVPGTRTLTINGTGYDLTADRSWTIGLQDVITQDPVLTASNTIDGGGFNLTFDNNYKVDVNTTGYSQMTSTGSSGSVASILVDTLTASGAVTITGTASGGATTSITTKSTEIQIKTPLYSTKAIGDVLKLVNPTTGEAEWGTPAASGVGLEAVLMLMGA